MEYIWVFKTIERLLVFKIYAHYLHYALKLKPDFYQLSNNLSLKVYY